MEAVTWRITIHSFIHSFTHYYVPGTLLHAGDRDEWVIPPKALIIQSSDRSNDSRVRQRNVGEEVIISNYWKMAKIERETFLRGNSMKKDIEISKYTKRIGYKFINFKKNVSKCLFEMMCEISRCNIWLNVILYEQV